MCLLPLDVKRTLAVKVPNALKVLLPPGAGLAQAVRTALPPTTKEPQEQQAIQAATAEAEKANVELSHSCFPVLPFWVEQPLHVRAMHLWRPVLLLYEGMSCML